MLTHLLHSTPLICIKERSYSTKSRPSGEDSTRLSERVRTATCTKYRTRESSKMGQSPLFRKSTTIDGGCHRSQFKGKIPEAAGILLVQLDKSCRRQGHWIFTKRDVFAYAPFTLKLRLQWELRARRTDQPPPSYHRPGSLRMGMWVWAGALCRGEREAYYWSN